MHDWKTYFDELCLYEKTFRTEATDFVRRLEEATPLNEQMRVLDFGCGFGFVADCLAPKVGEVFVWDSSANMRQCARINVAGHQNVRFADLTDPHAFSRDLTFDLILVNSVAQYLEESELRSWLRRWRDMLAPGGRVILSDLIEPGHNGLWDYAAYFRFSARNRFLARAIVDGLAESNRYFRRRRSLRLSHTDRDDLRRWAEELNLEVEFLPSNLTYRKRRTTAVLLNAISDRASAHIIAAISWGWWWIDSCAECAGNACNIV